MNRTYMSGSVPNVRKAKAIHDAKQRETKAKVAKLKTRAAATKRPR